MLKYLSKFASDILPSVAATIIGAYIVNHYITAKPAADAPVAAAVSSADPKKETSTDLANIPQAGVRAKGISEKAIFDKSAVDKPQEKPQEKSQEKAQAQEKPQEKSPEKSAEKTDDKPAETASIPADTRRHTPAPREKTAIRTIPLTTSPAVQPAASTSAPAVAPANPAPTVEAAVTPEDHRDANDLARAVIERLRGPNNEASPHAQEGARAPDAGPRIGSAPQAQPQAVRPLPPPIMVATPNGGESFGPAAAPSPTQPYPTSAQIDDPRRPTPPADIPLARPLDLRAETGQPAPQEHKNVAEDMLSAAKSVFHAVLPQ